MACRVTATAKSGKYRIVTDYVTDPSRNTVLMRVRSRRRSPTYKLYVRFDPTVNGNGGGGAGERRRRLGHRRHVDRAIRCSSPPTPDTATNAANRDYAQPVYAALDGPLTRGVERLRRRGERRTRSARRAHALHRRPDATRRQRRPARARRARGGRQARARARVRRDRRARPSARPRARSRAAFERRSRLQKGWKAYDDSLNKPPAERCTGSKGQTASARRRVLPERERAQGVRGQDVPGRDRREPRLAVGPGGLGGRSEQHVLRLVPRGVRARPLRGVDGAGRRRRPRDGARRDAFLFERQQLPDGSMPRNSLVNGKTAPDSFSTQLDECAYPILMAYQLGMTDASLYENHVKPRRTSSPRTARRSGPSAGRSRAATRRRRSRPRSRGSSRRPSSRDANRDAASARRLARRRRRLAALDQGLDGDDERPARAALLHPPLEDRRPERGDLVQRRQRRPDARPARGDRRRLPRARAARRAAGERPGRRRLAAGRRRDDRVRHRRAGRAGTATTATATATAPSDGHPWAPIGQGHRPPLARAVGRARRAGSRHGRRGRRGVAAPRDDAASPRASG